MLCGVKRRCVNLWKPLIFRKQVDGITEGVPSEKRSQIWVTGSADSVEEDAREQ